MTTSDISRVYDKLEEIKDATTAIKIDVAVVKSELKEVKDATEKNTKEIFGLPGEPGMKSKIYKFVGIVAFVTLLISAIVGGISVATMTRLVAPSSITGPAE